MLESKSLRIKGSVHDPRTPKDKKVYVRGDLVKVNLFLHGQGLPYVSEVTYQLHHTFKRNRISVRRTIDNPNCVLSIWTWGVFEVKATVIGKDCEQLELTHQLKWDKEIDNNTQYEYE